MKIVFLGDVSHPNAQSWIEALETTMARPIVTWSLPAANGRYGRLVRTLAWMRAVSRIRRVVSDLSPDLVIAYRTTSYGFLGALSGFHPLVVAAQGESDVWPVDSWSVGLKRRLARFTLKNADLIHAWGEHMAHDQVALGATRDKILVCPRGVDLQRFYAPSPFPPVDSLRLVCTRSLFPEYCHNVILDAVAAVARRGVPISLDIAGDGVLLGDLKNQASALGIADRVRFHGKVPHDRLPEMLRACNVYVAMPTTEGVSASLLEAMACGCYPIVSDLAANRQWIATGSGALVAVNDTEGLERALLAVWSDPTVVAAAAVHNRALVSEHASLKENIDWFIRSYRQLAANAAIRTA